MQVYAELRVLTARPTEADLEAAPHRLYGVMSVRERCSAGRWRDMAMREIATAQAAGAVPIIVGGTGLYLRALLEGIAEIPAVPPTIRAATEALHDACGGQAFRARLAARDPVTAARLADNDRQRLVRAYEVVEATGRSLSSFLAEPNAGPRLAATVVALLPPRSVLVGAINRRCETMIADGAIDEVRRLAAMGLEPALPAMKAVGVPALMAHVAGQIALPSALALFQTATRQYAKRQMTWLRHQLRPDLCLNAQFSESLEPEIFLFISEVR